MDEVLGMYYFNWFKFYSGLTFEIYHQRFFKDSVLWIIFYDITIWEKGLYSFSISKTNKSGKI